MTAPLRRILVDGGSGSGKTTIARRLCKAWGELCGLQVQLVSLDDCYPGWHGLAAGSRAVHETILRPRDPGYRRWDWQHQAPGEWVSLDPALPLLVEGCGAITPASRALADLALWVEMGEPTRRHRALARDGEGYAPWWQTWAEQEAVHWRRHRPQLLADLVVSPDSERHPATEADG